jgi:hypothetical protein
MPRPPSYYFKPVKVSPQPHEDSTIQSSNVAQPLTLQKSNHLHNRPECFEPIPKRTSHQAKLPVTPPATPPVTPPATFIPIKHYSYLQTPMTDRWLLDPMP